MEPVNLAQTLTHLSRYWESHRTAAVNQEDLEKPQPFTIALSREAGTGGTSIGRELGNKLGWVVYDDQLLERIAQDMGLRTNLLKSVDERRHSWLLETAETFLTGHSKSDWAPLVNDTAYVHHLIKTVLALGVNGECVIVGRGAAFILPKATTLRVRLMGTVKDRIAVLVRKLSVSEREAARRIRSIDRERTDFVRDHFLKDPTDPRNFDLVLNAPRLTVAQITKTIVDTLHHLQAGALENSTAMASS